MRYGYVDKERYALARRASFWRLMVKMGPYVFVIACASQTVDRVAGNHGAGGNYNV